MARYRGPRLRIIRRLGELPGLTQKSSTRNYPAGQHGPKKKAIGNQKTKESQYAVRLKEKQKLRFNYGISEKQMIRYVREARRRKGSTGELLLQLLEMRLDNILYRLGFSRTIASARQLISHGHILVNKKKITIPSYICKVNDLISVSETSKNFIQKHTKQENLQTLPDHLQLNSDQLTATVNKLISRDFVNLQINELLVVEYYSRKV